MQKDQIQSIERDIGQAISELRKMRKMTQRDLARKLSELGLNVDASAVSRMEKGDRALRISECLIIADALEVELSFLLGGVKTPAQNLKEQRKYTNLALEKMGEEAWNWLAGLTDIQLRLEQNPELIENISPHLSAPDEYLTWVASNLSEIEYVHDHFGAEAYIYANSNEQRRQLLQCVSAYFEARILVSHDYDVVTKVDDRADRSTNHNGLD